MPACLSSQRILYGVYGGYYALFHLSFYEQVMTDAWPHDDQFFSWDLARALLEMQEYQGRGFDYVLLAPARWDECSWARIPAGRTASAAARDEERSAHPCRPA